MILGFKCNRNIIVRWIKALRIYKVIIINRSKRFNSNYNNN